MPPTPPPVYIQPPQGFASPVFNSTHIGVSSAAGVGLSDQPRMLGAVFINTPGTSTTVTIYDDTSAAFSAAQSKVVCQVTASASGPQYLPFNLWCFKGIVAVVGGTGAPSVTITWL